MLIRLLIAAVLSFPVTAAAQASCSQAAARVAASPNVRVVSVQQRGKVCLIRVIEQRPGQRPRSRVVRVRL